MLTITPEGTAISGDNPCEIGSLSDGSSGVASWAIVFKENRTYTLQVQASGYDSSGSPCNSTESATVIVGGRTPATLFDNGYLLLIFVGAILVAAAVAAILLLRRRNKPKP